MKCELVDGPDSEPCVQDAVIRVQGLPCCHRHLMDRRREYDPDVYPETPLFHYGWTDHGEILPPGYVEDFRIVEQRGAFWAYFVGGNNFQNMRLLRAPSAGPLGPVDLSKVEGPLTSNHTRLYSGRVDENRRIITSVWPGLPRVGLWLFTETSFGMVKELLLAPKEGTGYSIAAANPAVAEVSPGKFLILFEGRNEVVHWHVFAATWDGIGKPVVDDEPLITDAANPSLVRHGDRLYLYYSKHDGAHFSTRAMSRAL